MMKFTGTKNEVADMVAEHAAMLSKMPVAEPGWKAVVFVGQMSPRRFMVGRCYQPTPAKVGDMFEPVYPSDFIGGMVTVAAI